MSKRRVVVPLPEYTVREIRAWMKKNCIRQRELGEGFGVGTRAVHVSLRRDPECTFTARQSAGFWMIGQLNGWLGLRMAGNVCSHEVVRRLSEAFLAALTRRNIRVLGDAHAIAEGRAIAARFLPQGRRYLKPRPDRVAPPELEQPDPGTIGPL